MTTRRGLRHQYTATLRSTPVDLQVADGDIDRLPR